MSRGMIVIEILRKIFVNCYTFMLTAQNGAYSIYLKFKYRRKFGHSFCNFSAAVYCDKKCLRSYVKVHVK